MKGSAVVTQDRVVVHCACGALALDAPVRAFGGDRDQMWVAAYMLAADTSARCADGIDRAPACEERARAKRHLQLIR